MQVFGWGKYQVRKCDMDHRIAVSCGALGWQRLVSYLLEKGKPFSALDVADVGCGTGTFGLMMALCGARVTLMDADPDSLMVARSFFDHYALKAESVQIDVLEPVPGNLQARFDVVASGGLAEHFIGASRYKCFAFHRSLLRPGGMARIGVPNKISPFYQMVRLFRIATGTWELDVEVPYTPGELRRLGHKAGFQNCRISGNYPLNVDAVEYSAGLISAALRLVPAVRSALHQRRAEGPKPAGMGDRDIRDLINASIRLVKSKTPLRKRPLTDVLSAGLNLFGFNAV